MHRPRFLEIPLLLLALAPLRGAASGTDYRIDPTSARVGFDLGATLHTVHGKASHVTGELHARAPEDGVLPLSGAIRIAAASLDTGNGRRDAKMHAESLDAARYPEIVFHPTRLDPALPSSDATGPTSHGLEGDLTVRGVTRSLKIPVRVESRLGRLLVDGSVEIAWADYGVPDPSVAFLRVRPTAVVHFHVELVPV